MLDVTPKPDWDQIKIDYEAGAVSVRQIAAREGISDTAVHKKARAEGWDGSLRKPDEPALPGLQTDVQTDVQTNPVTPEEYGRRLASAAHPKPDDDFEWTPGNDAVLLTDRPAVAVYLNNWNQIVIRKEAAWNDDEDPCIWLDRRDVPALIKRLEELARHGA
jgi:hypothetical protein